MRVLRNSLAVVAILCLAGWVWLHKPYSPTQELVPVVYTAFEVDVPNEEAGLALAKAARGWEGVQASTYNPASGLLVISHATNMTEQAVQTRLQTLVPTLVTKKIFPEPAGAKCPVPQEALAALPNWLLGAGIVLSVCFVLLCSQVARQNAKRSLIY